MLNHSSDLDFKGFMNLFKNCNAKPYSLLVIDATLSFDNLLCFRKNILERILKLIMTIDYQIRDEKLNYDNNIISALSCGRNIVNILILHVKKY